MLVNLTFNGMQQNPRKDGTITSITCLPDVLVGQLTVAALVEERPDVLVKVGTVLQQKLDEI